MPDFVQHLESKADNLLRFSLQRQLRFATRRKSGLSSVSIRVHPWLLAWTAKKTPRQSQSGVVKCVLVRASLPRLLRYFWRRNRSSESPVQRGQHNSALIFKNHFLRNKMFMPACSKSRSPVSASVKPSSPITTNERQSVRDHFLSGR
jgi:hypothetical protein